MDGSHNMLIGYSASGTVNGTDNHSMRYTGRAKDDPLGTMTAPEGIFVTGTRNETGTTRWGDYTSMSSDPADDCTFWYVNQFYPTGSTNGTWRTQVGSAHSPKGPQWANAKAARARRVQPALRPLAAPLLLGTTKCR